jgi:hypothetical protein
MVAMHLCEVAMKGEPLPPQLPLHLVPPSLRSGCTVRKRKGNFLERVGEVETQWGGSVKKLNNFNYRKNFPSAGVSTPGSVKSGSNEEVRETEIRFLCVQFYL